MKEERPLEETANKVLLSDLYSIVQELLLRGKMPEVGRSVFWVIGLNDKHQLLLMELLSNHTLENILPPELFQTALEKQASTIILCQCPQDQTWELEEKDYYTLLQLLQVGHLISLPLLDYLLLKKEGYYSLLESGDIEQLKPIEEEREELTEEGAEALAQEAVEQANRALEASYHEDKKEIALHLYEEGVTLAQIMELTGLSEESLLGILDL